MNFNLFNKLSEDEQQLVQDDMVEAGMAVMQVVVTKESEVIVKRVPPAEMYGSPKEGIFARGLRLFKGDA